jgi:hypothetical protein
VIESRTESALKTIQAGSQKKRRVDGALGLRAAGKAVSKGLPPTKQGLNIPDLLPIQHDSWFDLPERWDYCECSLLDLAQCTELMTDGPDGRRIKQRRWSPSHGGDNNTTKRSDRLNQNGDRNNATAATVAAWVKGTFASCFAGPMLI